MSKQITASYTATREREVRRTSSGVRITERRSHYLTLPKLRWKKRSWQAALLSSGGLGIIVFWLHVISAVLDGDSATAPTYSIPIILSLPALGLLVARDNLITFEAEGAK